MPAQIKKIFVATSKDLGEDQWKMNFRKKEIMYYIHKSVKCALGPVEIISCSP